ncbi:MAG: hypothetical protein FWG32_07900 [Oscillospiraceae bacterium]|nr:hypothetical protein [Oscillospiraceae bacterium]
MNVFLTSGALIYNIAIIVIVTAYMLISERSKKRGIEGEDLAMSGRSLHWFPCAAAIALTSLGGGHVNGIPMMTWGVGYSAMFFIFGNGVAILIIFRFSGIWFRRSGCVTVNDLLGKMFHPALAPILGSLGIMYCWLVICVETQGMAPLIAAITGLTNFQAGFAGAAIGILYMIVAGMKQIGLVNMWNAILMYLFGFIALFYLGYAAVGSEQGGFAAVAALADSGVRPELFHAMGNPGILRAYAIGTFLSAAVGLNMAQPQVQAIGAVPNVNVIKKACLAAIPMNTLIGLIVVGISMMSYALPLDIPAGMLAPGEELMGAQALLLVIMQYLPGWLQIAIFGVFLAAILSTFAMCVLCGVTMLTRDVLNYYPAYRDMSAKKHAVWNRIWILVFAFSAALAAITIKENTQPALTWGFAWNIPTLMIFIIGLYWKRSVKGGFIAFVISWAFNIILTFIPGVAAFFNLEGNNYSIFMIIASTVVGLIATALDKNCKPSFKTTYKQQRALYDAGTPVKLN